MLNGRRFLTVRQVSERLHISRRTIFDMIDNGTVPHYKIGGKLLIAEQDLENLLNASYRPSY
ncbi:helix-turn-helix domain-containing protein [uncultured Duncaniella sp.]